jgi:hypothetical protein
MTVDRGLEGGGVRELAYDRTFVRVQFIQGSQEGVCLRLFSFIKLADRKT